MSALTLQITHEELTAALKAAFAGQIVTYRDGNGLVAETAQALHEIEASIQALQSPWLTRRNAAEYARCSVGHIDYLAGKGEIKRHPGPRYRKDDIDKCILKGRFAKGNKEPKPGFKAKEQTDPQAEAHMKNSEREASYEAR